MIAAAAAENKIVQRSAAALLRQLLHSLADPVAVSRNELVAHLFPGRGLSEQYVRVRDAVMEAVESLRPASDTATAINLHRRRQYEILMRYDVQSQPLEDVLAALWIEKSQFYRERASALEHVAQTLSVWIEAQGGEASPHFEEYRVATALQRAGNSILARSILERLARTSHGIEKARCLLRIAELYIDGGEEERAKEFVASALSLAEPSDERIALLHCDASLVQAQLAWASGAGAPALSLLRSTIGAASGLLGSGNDDARSLFARALALEASITFHVSTLDECSRLVDEGCRLLDRDDDRTADTLADLLTIRTSIHTAKLDGLDDAKAHDDALMVFAKERGLVRKLAVGLKDLAVINHYRGNSFEALLYADQALALTSAVGGGKEQAVATFEWAHLHIESGDLAAMHKVREAVSQTRKTLPRGGFWWAYSYAIDSYALLAQNMPEEALNEAQVALASFRLIGSDRGVGIANALQSKGLQMLREVREAHVHAERAVEHLQRAPQTFWLPYAKELLEAAS